MYIIKIEVFVKMLKNLKEIIFKTYKTKSSIK